MAVEQDGADEDVEGAAADEAEEEGGVARDLGRNLELEEAGGCFERDTTLVKRQAWKGEWLRSRRRRGMHTETEDHDIASNNDGLAIVRKSAPTPAHDISSNKDPRARLVHRGPWPPGGQARAVGWQRSATGIGNVQAEREELGDTAEDHDDGNHQVDDATKTRGDMLAWGISIGATRDRLVDSAGELWGELRAPSSRQL